MKAKTVSIILLLNLSLLGVHGCRDKYEETERIIEVQQPSRPAVFELNIALAAGAEGMASGVDYESVKKDELRIIMINENTEAVEYNAVPAPTDIEGPDKNGKYEYVYKVKNLPFTAGTKRIYALGNVEALVGGHIEGLAADELVDYLNRLELPGAISSLSGGYIPMSSRAYRVELEAPSEDNPAPAHRVDIVMAYAAVKFDFTFVNNLDEDIRIAGWGINQVSARSYLIPHIESEEEWQKLIELGGRTFPENRPEDPWVTGYKVPADAGLYDYVYSYPKPWMLESDKNSNKKEENIFYYLHESKYMPEIPDKQEYRLSLRILTREMADNANPIILGPVKFPNLESLVRGTHVKVTATINHLPEAGDNSLDVRVRTWIQDDEPVEGGWEEVTGYGL